MSQIKIKRINEQIVRAIREIIMMESTDHFMKTVTITAADTSSDLSYAKVYFTSLSDMDIKQLEKEMNEAKDFFRKLLADKVQIRQIPKLEFIYDTSIAYGDTIEKKIKEIHEKELKK